MKNALQTALFCSAIALVGTSATAQSIQPLQGDGTVSSQQQVFDEEGVLIGLIVAGVFIAATGSGGGGGGDDSVATSVTAD